MSELNYTNIVRPSILLGGRIGFDEYNVFNGEIQTDNIPSIVNAFEVDWSGAKLDTENETPTIISTSEDLLKRVNDTYTKNIIDNQFERINTTLDTKVSNSQFEELQNSIDTNLDDLGDYIEEQIGISKNSLTEQINGLRNTIETLEARIIELETQLNIEPPAIQLYWYAGNDPISSETIPGSGDVHAFDENTLIGWHTIEGKPTEIQVGDFPDPGVLVDWYIAIPHSLNITKAYSGGMEDDSAFWRDDINSNYEVITLADGVEYNVFKYCDTVKYGIEYTMKSY